MACILLLSLPCKAAVQQIILSAEPDLVAADNRSFTQISAKLSDGLGYLETNAVNSVTFSIAGDASFTRSSTVYAINGIARINMLAGGTVGTVTVSATASGVTGDSIDIVMVPPSHYQWSDPYFPIGAFDSAISWAEGSNSSLINSVLNDIQSHNLDSIMLNSASLVEGNHDVVLGQTDSRQMYVVLNRDWNNRFRDYRLDTGYYEDMANANIGADDMVDEYGVFSSVKAWYIQDEPIWSWRDGLKNLKTAFNNRDSSRPAGSLYLGLGSQRAVDLFEYCKDDFMLLDVYPFHTTDPAGNFYMNGFGYPTYTMWNYIREIAEVKPAGYPLWLVLQTHNFGNYGADYSLRGPSPAEVKAQHWIAIGEGAQGIWWFVYSDINQTTTDFDQNMKSPPSTYTAISSCAQRTNPFKDELLRTQKMADEFTVNDDYGGYISCLSGPDETNYFVVVVNLDCVNSRMMSVDTDHFNCQLQDMETSQLYDLNEAISYAPGDGRVFKVIGERIHAPAPRNINVEVLSETEIDVMWDDITVDETGFLVQRKTAGGSFTDLGTVGAGVTVYHDTDCQADVDYVYRVKSLHNPTDSAYSDEVSIKITQGTPEKILVTVTPSTIPADGVSMARVSALVCDSSGQPLTLFQTSVTFTVEGSGVLVGANPATTVNGEAVITIESAVDPGVALVKAAAPGLSDGLGDVLFASAPNKLQNWSFELDENLNNAPDNWGGPYGGGNGEWDQTTGHFGQKSYKLMATNSYAYLDQNPVTLNPGQEYNLTCWIKMDQVEGQGVHLRYVQLNPGVVLYNTEYFNGDCDWHQISMCFTTAADYVSGRLDILWDMTNGTAWVDDVKLIEINADDSQSPSTPGAPTINEVMTAQVSFSWSPSTDNIGVLGYKIYRDGALVGTTNMPQYTDTGLQASTYYSYRVSAFDASGNTSAWSSATGATTEGIDTTPPSLPGNLRVSQTNSTSVILAWDAATDNEVISGYRIYRNGSEVGTSGSTGYTDTGLAPLTAYQYSVNAYDGAGNNGATTTPIQVTTKAEQIGVNVLQNGSFETGMPTPQYWAYAWANLAVGSVTDETSVDGNQSFKMIITPNGFNSSGYAYIDQRIPIESGVTNHLQAWIKTEGVTAPGVMLRVVGLNGDGGIWSTEWVSGTTNWAKYESSFVAPANVTTGRVDILWDNGAGTAYVDKIYFGLPYTDPDLDADNMYDAWEILNFGGTEVSDGTSDSDGDGFTDAQEFLAGTQPTNNSSYLMTLGEKHAADSTKAVILWPPATGREYSLMISTNLKDFTVLQSQIYGSSYTVDVLNTKSYYYRIRVDSY